LLDANERAAARRSVPAVMADMAPTLRVCAGRVWRERVERARKAGLSKKRVWTLESRVRRPASGYRQSGNNAIDQAPYDYIVRTYINLQNDRIHNRA
jgi:hypothetical protein